MRTSILNKMADYDFLLKALERFNENFKFLKNLEFL